jgi:hypothetical protein
MKTAKTVAATVASAGLSQGAARLTDTVLLSGASFLPNLTSAISGPGSALVEKLAFTPGIGLLTGAIAGLSLASGAAWGEEPMALEGEPLWKRFLMKPSVDLFNDGIKFRHQVNDARNADSFRNAFSFGARAGFQVGAQIGGTAGRIQGAVSGGLIGWQVSGEALRLTRGLLQGTPLPPILQDMLPLVVGASCVMAGQSVGAAVGGVVGQVAGGSFSALATGLYAGYHRY